MDHGAWFFCLKRRLRRVPASSGCCVEDVLHAVQQGLMIKQVNVGGMRYSAGKKQIMKAVAIDQLDSNHFKKLLDEGIKVDIQMVPTDAPVPIDHYL